MTKDRRTLYAVSVSIFTLLFLALFLPYGGSSRILAAILLLPAAATVHFAIKKRSIPSINRRQVLLLMGVIALLALMLLYLTGLRFGFRRSGTPLSGTSFLTNILPIAVIIIATEIIRTVLLAQESRFSAAIAYATGIVTELLAVANLAQLRSFSMFMDFVGLTLIPAVTANILYQYLARHHGAAPNILYRLVLLLYPFVIPRIPAIPDAFLAFFKLVLPLLIYLFLRLLYEKRRKKAAQRPSKWTYVGIGAALAVTTAVVMLISCQFRFGALVIATESMTGELNKGDVIIYEQYDDQKIEEGQVIVFRKGASLVIHRVIDVQHIDHQTQYYTKGDANDSPDTGFITDADIVGITNLKIPYLGHPTLWLRGLFAKNAGGN
ncbi:MAG: signal peptidase I [Clostridia bacterium]|nr:signal peptidase I [Clostridia bacterium]